MGLALGLPVVCLIRYPVLVPHGVIWQRVLVPCRGLLKSGWRPYCPSPCPPCTGPLRRNHFQAMQPNAVISSPQCQLGSAPSLSPLTRKSGTDDILVTNNQVSSCGTKAPASASVAQLTTGAHRAFLAQTASCITEPTCHQAQPFLPSPAVQKQPWFPEDIWTRIICTDKFPSPKISSLMSPGQSPEIAQC